MTNEIKEILDDLDFCKNIKRGKILLNSNECDIFLDYITNLQNEIFDLKDTIQNKNDCIGAYDCIIEDRDKRIDKAVEYINHEWFKREQIGIVPLQFSYEELQNVLNILRGDE